MTGVLETGCKSLIIYLFMFAIESTHFKLGLLYLENMILGNVKLIKMDYLHCFIKV